MKVEPTTLTGRVVRLEPLALEHAGPLLALATPDLFALSPQKPEPWSEEGMRAELRSVPGAGGRELSARTRELFRNERIPIGSFSGAVSVRPDTNRPPSGTLDCLGDDPHGVPSHSRDEHAGAQTAAVRAVRSRARRLLAR
jgi:hypothetical protein